VLERVPLFVGEVREMVGGVRSGERVELNIAFTVMLEFTVTVQFPVPEQMPPLQPENMEPELGFAAKITD